MLLHRFSTLLRQCGFGTTTKLNHFRLVSSKVPQIEDPPVKFTSSGASKWKAETSRTGISNRLWYEPHVILVSLSIFLIYFGVLREENDIDAELNKSLYSRIEGLEEYELRNTLKYNREHNIDTNEVRQRLEQIEREKKM